MGMVAERLNLRLFIDGIEVPVVGAKCTFSEGAPASAEVQVVATDQVYDLTPRSFVTLFVYDNFDYVDDPATGERNALRIGPHDLRRWKLLFSGELVAVSMSKQSGSRAASLTCVDTTNYWDFIKQQYINFRSGGVELFEAAFLGIKQDRLKFFDVVTQGVHSKLYTWLTQSKNSKGEPSLYLGIQRLLREMYFSVNDFYAEAFNRLRIGDTIVGLEEDETAANLFSLQFFEKFIKNQVGGAGGMITARQLVNSLLGPVFHTYVTVPFPKFDRRGDSLGFRVEEASDLANGIIDRSASWETASLNQTIIKPDTWFLAPPACNVVFPHQYRSLTYSRNYLAEPTRLFLRTSLIFTGQDKWMTERFYAPDFEVFNALLYQKGGYLKRMAQTLLPHERFVGLNPVQVWQSDLPAYVQKGARREYLAQLADYLYWKYKFGTRTVNVSGPLNLNLVPGYPGLVMDRVDTQVGVTRHFLGNIRSVVHSVDQAGGWTHYSLVGARVHDESIDYDEALHGEIRSLEEITSRGTDGYLDDRYDVERIGPEVYRNLFGCGSIVDVLSQEERFKVFTREVTRVVEREMNQSEIDAINEATQQATDVINVVYQEAFNQSDAGPDNIAGFSSEEANEVVAEVQDALNKKIEAIAAGATTSVTETVEEKVKLDLVPLAVQKLHDSYRKALKSEADISRFTAGITNRPKANFAELMGVDLQNVPPRRSDVNEAVATARSIEALKKQDPEIAENEGFFASAVNPQAKSTADNSYGTGKYGTVQVPRKVVEEVTVVPEEEVFDSFGNPQTIPEVTQSVEKVVYDTERGDEVRGKYPLQENLEARREKVLAYVGSLMFRGMRG